MKLRLKNQGVAKKTICNFWTSSVHVLRLSLNTAHDLFLVMLIVMCLLGDKVNARTRQTHESDVIVKTVKGRVRGFISRAANGLMVESYLGIPFAKPPVGEYRFRHPKHIDPWDGIFNATKMPNSCFQIFDEFFGADFQGSKLWNANTPMSEDCLYLNVWVPYSRDNKRKKLTVMVWIFGGGFFAGTSTLDIYDGSLLATEENVVVVSMNYRVASLGFIHIGGRSDVPGNAGLLDQVMALEWVRDNIAFFGGSASKVTIFGESSGAVSCSLHLLSSLSRNLFQYAILQSGASTAPWVITEKPEIERRAINLAKVVNCYDDDTDILMDCMRKVDPRKLVENEFVGYGVVEFPFTPIIDGAFLDEYPEESLKKKNFKKTKLLIGGNREEGNFHTMYFLPKLFELKENVVLTRKQFLESVRKLYPNYSDLAIKAIVFQYTDWVNFDDPVANRDMIDKMVGDLNFNCPVFDWGSTYAMSGNDVYVYHFTHRYSTHPYPEWTGVLHGDEVLIVFGDPLKPHKNYQTSEVKFSKAVMKYWANFAKTGNPNTPSRSAENSVVWKKHSVYNKEYLVLGMQPQMKERGPRIRECAFWREYLPQLISIRSVPANNTSQPNGMTAANLGNLTVADNRACPVTSGSDSTLTKAYLVPIFVMLIFTAVLVES